MKQTYRSRTVLCLSLVLLAGIVFLTAAQAADSGSVSGSVGVYSDYLFRGISQTNQKPALQAGIEYDHSSGFYVGAWGSNISWLSDASSDAAPISSSLEIDGYAGWRTATASGVNLDFGVYEYRYPGTYPPGFTRPNTTEVYGAVGYAGFTLKYSNAVTNLFGFEHSHNSAYTDLSWNHDFSGGWSLGAHAGHQTIKNVSGANYTDWNLRVSHSLGKSSSISLGYYDTTARRKAYTNAYGHYLGRATGVLSLSTNF